MYIISMDTFYRRLFDLVLVSVRQFMNSMKKETKNRSFTHPHEYKKSSTEPKL